ncbi:hypothetical protein BBJ28_00002454 [Nothophytophthora sp. Chile5]|nr:hypothetical protein BBJ28_00002454 [Nothophytophthora sp. Chile5]
MLPWCVHWPGGRRVASQRDQSRSDGQASEAARGIGAVAHVDNAAWKHVLVAHCRVGFPNEEEAFDGDFPSLFQLRVPQLLARRNDDWHAALRDLMRFCGPKQHAGHSQQYEIALWRAKASANGTQTMPSELQIPITVPLDTQLILPLEHILLGRVRPRGTLDYLWGFHRAIQHIRTQWQRYSDEGVAPRKVTFALAETTSSLLGACANMVELAVSTQALQTHVLFPDNRLRDLLLSSTLGYSFDDVAAIGEALRDASNPLAKRIRRLRVRLDRIDGDYPFNDTCTAMATMLQVNRILEYLDVVAKEEHMTCQPS